MGELRERIARVVADAIENDFDDAEYEGYGHDAARYWAADRILSDPQIERALRIAEQEPVAWQWILRNRPDVEHITGPNPLLHALEADFLKLVPLVPLTTSSEGGAP